MTYKLTIHGELTSLNEYTAKCRSSAKGGGKTKKQNHENVLYQIPIVYRGLMLSGVYVHMTWFTKDKMTDPDNTAFAKKYILDALVEKNVLAGDGRRHIYGFRDDFDVNKNDPRVEVEITVE